MKPIVTSFFITYLSTYIYLYIYIGKIDIYIYMHIYIYIYIHMQSWKQCALLFITTMALWQLMHLGTWWTVHHVPKYMGCHKAIVVITRRAHCFHDCIYIIFILHLLDSSTLCVVDHSLENHETNSNLVTNM